MKTGDDLDGQRGPHVITASLKESEEDPWRQASSQGETEDATLPAVRTEEGCEPRAAGASRSWERQGADPPQEPPEGTLCQHRISAQRDPRRTSDPQGWTTTLIHDTPPSTHLEHCSCVLGPLMVPPPRTQDTPQTHTDARPCLTFPSVLSWKLSTRAASVHLAATSRAAFRRRSWSSRKGQSQ